MAHAEALLTTAQAAAALGLDTSSIRHYVLKGRLPATKHGRDWLIKAADLKRLERRVYRRGQGAGEAGQSLSRPSGTIKAQDDKRHEGKERGR